MGKLIVIDGLDGSGKATQSEKLYTWLKEHGYNAHKVSFPAYESNSSALVKMYLNGEISKNADDITPYAAASFYAVDRYVQYQQHIKHLYEQSDSIIIADRYLSANIVHQGSKIEYLEERHKFFEWVYDYEVGLLGIPKEDKVIILGLPIEVSQQLMAKRYMNDESKKDIHESNLEYLGRCYISMQSAVKYFEGRDWEYINCASSNGEINSIDTVFSSILNIVKPLL